MPLERRARRRRNSSWPTWVVVLCVLGGVVGGALGGLALTFYQRGAPRAESREQSPRQTPAEVSDGTTAAPQSGTTTTAGAQESKPADAQATASPTAEVVAADAQAPSATPQEPSRESAKVEAASAPAGPEAEGELRAALGGWLAATNSRDVGRQMDFYAQKVEAFYLARNASRDAVRAEKARLFSRASAVNVEAAPPEIRMSPDGRTAVMRFRKRYRIDGEDSRSGEVLQELRWRRTGTGWKIVGERDLRVLQ